jgi:hypothetical protein
VVAAATKGDSLRARAGAGSLSGDDPTVLPAICYKRRAAPEGEGVKMPFRRGLNDRHCFRGSGRSPFLS